MRLRLFAILIVVTGTSALGQTYDTIKLKLVAGQEVIRGANIVVKDHFPIIGTTTDMDGVATFIIPNNKDKVEISFIGPYVRLKIERPTDSIYFDLNSKKATFYNNKRKQTTKKQIVSGY